MANIKGNTIFGLINKGFSRIKKILGFNQDKRFPKKRPGADMGNSGQKPSEVGPQLQEVKIPSQLQEFVETFPETAKIMEEVEQKINDIDNKNDKIEIEPQPSQGVKIPSKLEEFMETFPETAKTIEEVKQKINGINNKDEVIGNIFAGLKPLINIDWKKMKGKFYRHSKSDDGDIVISAEEYLDTVVSNFLTISFLTISFLTISMDEALKSNTDLREEPQNKDIAFSKEMIEKRILAATNYMPKFKMTQESDDNSVKLEDLIGQIKGNLKKSSEEKPKVENVERNDKPSVIIRDNKSNQSSELGK